MTIQILEVVLFSHDGRQRILPLRPGAVSLITGASKTGKSALIDIVDYCLGAGTCRVPEGPIRRSVAWFGLRLQLADGEAFVARRCPSGAALSSEDCFVEVAASIKTPEAASLRQTTNTKGVNSLLSAWTGIAENIHEPPPGQKRPALSANVRHALALCFQPQDEIIRKLQLFHGANDSFFAQALKDTIPYLLGAVDSEHVQKKEQLRLLRDQVRACDRQLAELRALSGDGVSKAAALLAQARDVGISDSIPSSWDDTILALRQAGTISLADARPEVPVNAEYGRLISVRDQLLAQQSRLSDEIASVRAFESAEDTYSEEVTEQRGRLRPIGIFEGSNPEPTCPLCSQDLPSTLTVPAVSEVTSALSEVSSRLEAVSRAAPQALKAIAELEGRLKLIQSDLTKNRSEIEAVRRANDQLQRSQDEESRRAMVAGRISLYLESLPELPDTKLLEERARALRIEIASLEEELSDEAVRERVSSIASILSGWMTEWARELELEHSKFPLRLEIGKLTVVADTADGPVPMDRMGSGENWVGYHLIAHLALHRWFVNQKRPVPRFLFLDQPSQVYFPPEKDIDGALESIGENDRLAVSRMFRFVFDVVKELAPAFQVVITEHADINEPWYQAAIVERWRGGKKLVPDDWPRPG